MTEKIFIASIEEHAGIIHKIIGMYIDDAMDKEDAYQEVVLQAWKSKNSFRGEAKFSTWLYKVALNTVLTALRKQNKNTTSLNEGKQIEAYDTSNTNDKYVILQSVIKTLNEADRTLIIMHLDGFTNPEIADFLGITINHTNVKIHRIKTKITERITKLENYGMDR